MSLADSGLVIVDKPAGMTSHDVVGRLRRIYQTRKVGHAGTLDPMATGVLIAGIERGTKFLAHLGSDSKSYVARVRLGATTTTEDAEGDIVHTASPEMLSELSEARIHDAASHLRGDILQRPSSVSAIKINGKRAYQRVREGEEVSIPPRPVTIHELEISDISPGPDFWELTMTVSCSSGTYIRALARDLGEALGVGGHLRALRRTRVGAFVLDDALSLEELADAPTPPLISLDEALPRCYPALAVSEAEATKLSLGQWLEPRGLMGTHAAIDPEGRAIALIAEQGRRLSTVFVARPATLTSPSRGRGAAGSGGRR